MLPKLWAHLFRTSYDRPMRPADTPAPSPTNKDVEHDNLWDDEDPDLVEFRIVAEKMGSPKSSSETNFTDKVISKERTRTGLHFEAPSR